MSFGGGATVAAAKVVLGVEAGQFSEGLRSAEAQWATAMGEMGGATAELAERQLRAAAAAERLDMAVRQGAAGTVRATEATAALVREQRKLVDVQLEADAAATKFGSGVQRNQAHVSAYGRALGFTTSALIGGAGLVYGIKLAVDASQKFQQQMILIQTQALKSRGEVDQMTKAVMHLAGPLATAPTDLSKGLYHVESSGYSAAKAVEVLTTATKGARIGQSDLEQTTNALVAALRTGIRGTKDMHMAMSTLDAIVGAGNMRMDDLAHALSSGVVPAAKQFGLSLADLGGALDTLTIKGVPAELAATRLRYTIALLGASTPKAAKQLESIGIADGRVAHIMRTQGLVPALELLQEKLASSGKSIEAQNEILVRAYGGGRSSTTILTLLQNLRELQHRTEIIEKQGTASKFAARWQEQTQTAAFAFDQLRAIVSKTAIELGDALLPGTVKSAQAISTWLDKAQNQHRLQSDLRQGFHDVSDAAQEFGHILHDIADGFHLVDEAVPGNLLKLLLEGFLLFKAAKIAQGFTTAFVNPLKEMVKQTKTAQKEVATLETQMTRGTGGNLPGSVLPLKSLRPDVAGGAPLAMESAAFDKVATAIGKKAVALRTLDGIIDDQGGVLDSQAALTQETIDDTAANNANVASIRDKIAAYDQFQARMTARAALQEENFQQDTFVGYGNPPVVAVRGRARLRPTMYTAEPGGQGQFGNLFAAGATPDQRAQIAQVAPAMPLPLAFAITADQQQMIADRWNPLFQAGNRTKEPTSMTAQDIEDLQQRVARMSPAAQQAIMGAFASGEGWSIGDLNDPFGPMFKNMSPMDLQQLEEINPGIARAIRLQRNREISGMTTGLRGGMYSPSPGPGLGAGPISDQYKRVPGTMFGGDRYFRQMPDGSLVRVGAEEYFGRYARTNERAAAPTEVAQAERAVDLEAARQANQEQVQAHEAALRAARQRLSSARGALSAMPVPAGQPISPAEMAALEGAAGQARSADERFWEDIRKRGITNLSPDQEALSRRLQRARTYSGYALSDAQTQNYMARQASLPYGMAQSNVEQAQAEVEQQAARLEAARQEGIRLAQAQARNLSQTTVEQRPYTGAPIQEPFPGYQYPPGATAGYSGRVPMAAGGVAGGRVPPGYEMVSGPGGTTMMMPTGSGYPRQLQGEPTLAEKAALRDEAAAARQNLEAAQARAAEMRRQAESARATAEEDARAAAAQRESLGAYAQATAKNTLREQELTPLQQKVNALTAELQAARGKTSAAYVEEQPAEPGTGVPARPAGFVKRVDRYPRYGIGENVGGVEEARLAGTNRIIPLIAGKPASREEIVQYLRKQRAEAQAAVREYEAANPKMAEGFPQGIIGTTREAQITASRSDEAAAAAEREARAAEAAVKPVQDIAAAWDGVVERIGVADEQLTLLGARLKVIAGLNMTGGNVYKEARGPYGQLTGEGLVGQAPPAEAAATPYDVRAGRIPAVALSKEAKQAIMDRAGYAGNIAAYSDEYTKLAQSAGLAQRPLQKLAETEVQLGRETDVSMRAIDEEAASLKMLETELKATGAIQGGAVRTYRGPQAVLESYGRMGKNNPLVTGLNWDELMVAQKQYQTQIAGITDETGKIVEDLGVTEEDLAKLQGELAMINQDIARVESGIAAEARGSSRILPTGEVVSRSPTAFTGAKPGIGPGGVVSADAAAMAAEEKTMMASSAAMLATLRQQMKAMRTSIAESSLMSRMGGMGRGMGMNQAMGAGMLLTMFGGQIPGIGGMMSGAGMGLMFAPMLGINPLAGLAFGGALGARSLVRNHVHGTAGNFAGNIAGGALAGAGFGLAFAPESLGLSVLAGAGIGAAATGLQMLFHSSDSTAKALNALGAAAQNAHRGVAGGRMMLQTAKDARANDKYSLDQAKAAWQAAKAEEKATRGTRDHSVAVDKLNAAYQNYKAAQRQVTADVNAEDRARKQISTDTQKERNANNQLAQSLAKVGSGIKHSTELFAYGTTATEKARFKLQQYISRMNDLADKAQKTNPKLATTYKRLAEVANETNKIPTDPKYIKLIMKVGWEGTKEARLTLALISGQLGKQFPLLFGKGGRGAVFGKDGIVGGVEIHYDAKTGLWVDSHGHPVPNQQAAWNEWLKKHGVAQPSGGATEPMPARAHRRRHTHDHGGGHGGGNYVDPSSSSYLAHLNSQIAQIQAGLMKGNVKKLEEEELRWLRQDYKRARTDAERQAIAEAITAIQSQMASDTKKKQKSQGDSLIPQSLQDQYNKAYQHHNKKGELEALEKEKKLLEKIAAHSHGARHHKAEQELNAVIRQIAALMHTSTSAAGFLTGKQAQEWIKLQNRYAKAQQTPSTKDDIAALKAEQKFLQRVRDHLHGKAQLEANKLLAQIDKKLQKLVELQTETIKELERTYLSDLASFFASFGSDVFQTGPGGIRTPGSSGGGTGQTDQPVGGGGTPPPGRPPVAATRRGDGPSSVTVVQNFPKDSHDDHKRHAIYARHAVQSQFDG